MINLSKIFSKAGSKFEVTAITSGGHRHEHGHQHEEYSHPNKGFQCQMKCEGDKLYDDPGNCPVCNMKLVSLEDNKQEGHHHGCC